MLPIACWTAIRGIEADGSRPLSLTSQNAASPSPPPTPVSGAADSVVTNGVIRWRTNVP